ncbi:MAG TPA: SGNH/GDSL hydrolase family protein [Acidimicrobiales bacterium]
MRGPRFVAVLAGALVAALPLALPAPLPAAAVAPSASASAALPNSMAAIGDSITQGVDDCCSLGSHPQDSWSTGNGWPANGVLSHYQRILSVHPAIAGRAYNDSVPGATVADAQNQAAMAVAQGAQYVTILIGANDVCTSTIASMTTTSAFQTAFQSALSTLESGLPGGAHVFVSSIPDIYQLWSVLHTNPTAEAVWSGAHICQSMFATSNTEAQRQQVLAQEEADNAVLGQVCTQYANCRWDHDATFNVAFTSSDVSSIDYFHPSQSGQATLASVTWSSSWWPSASGGAGYWLAAGDGGVFAYGDAPFQGSAGAQHLVDPVTGLVATPDGGGYWLVARDGGVFSYGDAVFHGSAGALRLDDPTVGIAATPDGNGYWLVAGDGGVFSYGDAVFYGSAGAQHLNAPIVGMAAMPDGGGYWLVARDGGVFAYGDAAFQGSAGALDLNAPIVGTAATADGGGYWLVASDGGVFSYGDAVFHGSAGAQHLNAPITGMATTPDGGGYWLVASDGGVFAYGDAPFHGSAGALPLSAPVVGLANDS